MPDTDTTAVLQELAATRAAMTQAVEKIRRRQRSFAVLSVLTVLFLIGYLGYAYHRFGRDVNPDTVAAELQTHLSDNLPQTQANLEQKLRENAPNVVASAFDQMEALPAKYTEQLQAEATRRMDAAMPDVQSQMYQAMRVALDQSIKAQAAAGGADKDDETRLRSTLQSVSEVYASETMRFVNEAHNTYASDALAFTDYLDRLATARHLDHRDQLHRDMFRTIFALVRVHADNTGTTDPLDMTMFKPAS